MFFYILILKSRKQRNLTLLALISNINICVKKFVLIVTFKNRKPYSADIIFALWKAKSASVNHLDSSKFHLVLRYTSIANLLLVHLFHLFHEFICLHIRLIRSWDTIDWIYCPLKHQRFQPPTALKVNVKGWSRSTCVRRYARRYHIQYTCKQRGRYLNIGMKNVDIFQWIISILFLPSDFSILPKFIKSTRRL